MCEVRVQAVEWHHKTRKNMEDVLDEYTLTMEGEDSYAATKDRDEQIVSHTYLLEV